MQLQLRSLVRGTGQLVLSLDEVPIPRPSPTELLVRMEAAPLNPSDHGQAPHVRRASRDARSFRLALYLAGNAFRAVAPAGV